MGLGPGPDDDEPAIGSTWRAADGRLLRVASINVLPGEIVMEPADGRATVIRVPREEWADVGWTAVT